MSEICNDGKDAQEEGGKLSQVISWLLAWLQHHEQLNQIWNKWLKHMEIKSRRNYNGITYGWNHYFTFYTKIMLDLVFLGII